MGGESPESESDDATQGHRIMRKPHFLNLQRQHSVREEKMQELSDWIESGKPVDDQQKVVDAAQVASDAAPDDAVLRQTLDYEKEELVRLKGLKPLYSMTDEEALAYHVPNHESYDDDTADQNAEIYHSHLRGRSSIRFEKGQSLGLILLHKGKGCKVKGNGKNRQTQCLGDREVVMTRVNFQPEGALKKWKPITTETCKKILGDIKKGGGEIEFDISYADRVNIVQTGPLPPCKRQKRERRLVETARRADATSISGLLLRRRD